MIPIISPWIRSSLSNRIVDKLPPLRHQAFTSRFVQRYVSVTTHNSPTSEPLGFSGRVEIGILPKALRVYAPSAAVSGLDTNGLDREGKQTSPNQATDLTDGLDQKSIYSIDPTQEDNMIRRETEALPQLLSTEVEPAQDNENVEPAHRSPAQLSADLRRTLRRARTDSNTNTHRPIPEKPTDTQSESANNSNNSKIDKNSTTDSELKNTTEDRETTTRLSRSEESHQTLDLTDSASMIDEIERRIQRAVDDRLRSSDAIHKADSVPSHAVKSQEEPSEAVESSNETSSNSMLDEIERRIQQAAVQKLADGDTKQSTTSNLNEKIPASQSRQIQRKLENVSNEGSVQSQEPARRTRNSRIYSQVEEMRGTDVSQYDTFTLQAKSDNDRKETLPEPKVDVKDDDEQEPFQIDAQETLEPIEEPQNELDLQVGDTPEVEHPHSENVATSSEADQTKDEPQTTINMGQEQPVQRSLVSNQEPSNPPDGKSGGIVSKKAEIAKNRSAQIKESATNLPRENNNAVEQGIDQPADQPDPMPLINEATLFANDPHKDINRQAERPLHFEQSSSLKKARQPEVDVQKKKEPDEPALADSIEQDSSTKTLDPPNSEIAGTKNTDNLSNTEIIEDSPAIKWQARIGNETDVQMSRTNEEIEQSEPELDAQTSTPKQEPFVEGNLRSLNPDSSISSMDIPVSPEAIQRSTDVSPSSDNAKRLNKSDSSAATQSDDDMVRKKQLDSTPTPIEAKIQRALLTNRSAIETYISSPNRIARENVSVQNEGPKVIDLSSRPQDKSNAGKKESPPNLDQLARQLTPLVKRLLKVEREREHI